MNYKDKFVLIIILVLALPLAGCSKTENSSVDNDVVEILEEELFVIEKETPEDKTIVTETEETEPIDDLVEENSVTVEEIEGLELNEENIFWLQESLKIAGYTIAVDGNLGPNTKKAFKSFKEKEGFLSDSVYTAEVKKRLESIRKNNNEVEIEIEVVESEDDSTEKDEKSFQSAKVLELNYKNVYWLQESLKMAGHYTPLDGRWGSNTEKVLEDFKKEKGLSEIEIYDEETKIILEGIREKNMINDPTSDLILLNKSNFLSSTYVPKNLVEADLPKSKYMALPEHVALKAKEMFLKASEDGHGLYFASGYRSFEYQETLFSRRVAKHGFDAAEKVVAIPGQSEHQTGLAIDITTEEMGYGLSQSFDQTEAFDWLINNCYKYGFILRYRKGKEDLTGYIYEPWHYRYIGDVEIAEKIMAEALVLEEYLKE